MISCCAEASYQEILQEINTDEAQDCSNREQMPVFLSNGGTLLCSIVGGSYCTF